MYLNTAKLHQPNLPHPDFAGRSMGKSKFLDSLVELDHWVGVVADKVRELDIADETLIFWTTDNGARQRSRGRWISWRRSPTSRGWSCRRRIARGNRPCSTAATRPRC